MRLREIHPAGAVVALSYWLLADGTVAAVEFPQEDYEKQQWPAPPEAGAEWLLSAGGRPVFDTPDGKIHAGDVQVHPNGALTIQLAEGEDFSYYSFRPDFEREEGGKFYISGPERNMTSNGHQVLILPGEYTGSPDKATLRAARSDFSLVAGELTVVRATDYRKTEGVVEKETHHSVAFAAVTSGSGSSSSSLTFSHTVSAGSDLALFVGSTAGAGAPGNVTSVTFNGDAMTEDWDVVAQTFLQNGGFHLVPPDVATGDVVITWDATNNGNSGVAISLTGVNQTTPVGTPVTGDGTTGPATVNVTSETDALVVDNVHYGTNGSPVANLVAGSDQTERWTFIETFASARGASTEPGAASVTMSWSSTDGDYWATGAVSFKPAGGAPPATAIRDMIGGGIIPFAR